jgi:hypothetical protein
MNQSLRHLLIGLAVAACSDGGQVTAPSDGTAGLSAKAERGDPDADDRSTRMYDITITNLTGGQPLSPGVAAIHTKRNSVWRLGRSASEGIRLIAEDGDNSVALASLTGQPGFSDVQAVPTPTGCVNCPGPFATSQTIRVSAKAGANRLSLAIMLICTNDGFTGLDAVKLPRGFKRKTFYAAGYDAGTEVNDQLSTHIVEPCFAIGPTSRPPDGNLRTPETGAITMHPGITGVGDLAPAAHGWTNPVARITVQRVKRHDGERVTDDERDEE